MTYPPVAIHYDGEEGSCDYPTEENFTDVVNTICSPDILGENGSIKVLKEDGSVIQEINKDTEEFHSAYKVKAIDTQF